MCQQNDHTLFLLLLRSEPSHSSIVPSPTYLFRGLLLLLLCSCPRLHESSTRRTATVHLLVLQTTDSSDRTILHLLSTAVPRDRFQQRLSLVSLHKAWSWTIVGNHACPNMPIRDHRVVGPGTGVSRGVERCRGVGVYTGPEV